MDGLHWRAKRALLRARATLEGDERRVDGEDNAAASDYPADERTAPRYLVGRAPRYVVGEADRATLDAGHSKHDLVNE